MQIEEMYMEILKIREQVIKLDEEIYCRKETIECSECEYEVFCDALNVAERALYMAKILIENS